jgi:hypothetical protein
MASEGRIRELLKGSGFSSVRTEEVPVRFAFRDVDEYVRFHADTAGPFAIVIRGLPEGERKAIKAQVGEAFAAFVSGGGYVLPGVALTAVAS